MHVLRALRLLLLTTFVLFAFLDQGNKELQQIRDPIDPSYFELLLESVSMDELIQRPYAPGFHNQCSHSTVRKLPQGLNREGVVEGIGSHGNAPSHDRSDKQVGVRNHHLQPVGNLSRRYRQARVGCHLRVW